MNSRFLFAVLGLACVCGLAYARQNENAEKSVCVSNQKQLAIGVAMYVQDYDERFPIMTTPAHLQHRVFPYVKNNSIFKCPTSGEDYLPNPALNYLSLEDVASPPSTLLLRDATPHKTETGAQAWVVAYVDGHVKTVSSEPKLGKPAPPPTRQSRIREVTRQLASLRQYRIQMDKQISDLEKELRRTNRKR